ncbi:N-acetylmuramoyl-L-alanine amidase [Myxococcota bacterium]|nr:N-acetylmuramoyl-L-alanine amidase [Myxococcota bacterium]
MHPHLLLGAAALTLLTGAAPGLDVVVIDPGHGGTNMGAPARAAGTGWEKEHTLRIARRVAEHLRAEGVTVYLTRWADVDMTLANRVRYANAHKADVFVSVHLNSTEKPGPVGHETFFLALESSDEAARRLAAYENEAVEAPGDLASAPSGAAETDVADILRDLGQTQAHEDAQALAAAIQRRMTPQSPFPNRGVLQAPFNVLMGASMPAVVVEAGFLNHPKEGLFVTSEDGHARIARGIADGILDFGRLVAEARKARPTSARAPAPPAPPTTTATEPVAPRTP